MRLTLSIVSAAALALVGAGRVQVQCISVPNVQMTVDDLQQLLQKMADQGWHALPPLQFSLAQGMLYASTYCFERSR